MSRDKKPNVLLEIAVTIVVPALILTYLSGKDRLGTTGALLFALALPLGWGIWDGLKRRKLNWLAVLGVVTTLLTNRSRAKQGAAEFAKQQAFYEQRLREQELALRAASEEATDDEERRRIMEDVLPAREAACR